MGPLAQSVRELKIPPDLSAFTPPATPAPSQTTASLNAGLSASIVSTRCRRASIAGSGIGSPVASRAVSSFFAVTDVTHVTGEQVRGVDTSIIAGFGVTLGIAPSVTDVTTRPSNLASRASSAMIAPQLVGLDQIQAHQPPVNTLRLGAFAAVVGFG